MQYFDVFLDKFGSLYTGVKDCKKFEKELIPSLRNRLSSINCLELWAVYNHRDFTRDDLVNSNLVD